ncbi:MAG TPA: DmsE family decaheme c-type cytochrome [Blastocatellia bacterium]|jgi:predicted CXXCH cytochrome family protein|nr:DmsE family decaheme c-type cytochrome [Blastocatellia bacterium]
MKRLKATKWALVTGWLTFGVLFAAGSSFSNPAAPDKDKAASVTKANDRPDDFLGSETCKACHEDQFNSFSKTAHSHLAKAGWKNEGCESCHGGGKAHVEAGGDKTKIRTFESESPKQISESCLACHAGKEEHNNYRRGEHWRNDVSCVDCHSPHFSKRLADKLTAPHEPKDAPSSLIPVGPSRAHSTDLAPPKMLINSQPQLCMTCHNETKAQFTQPFHHRVLEGSMNCSDCHNPHGGFEAKQARLAGADAACFKCHADKQGPFVFEHAPLKTEGCTICHQPHGASNSKLLKRNNVNQLCLECHSQIATKLGEEPAPGAPGTPSFHNQATLRFQNCTTCHVKIHGSNSHPVFFR